MKRLAAIFLLLSVTLLAAAQTTKVRGRVTDTSGEGIPFAGVYFEDTTIGITTDLDGYYYLETRDLTAVTLIAQLLGYNTATTKVTPGVFNQRNFVLEVTDNELTGARVKADNRKARRLLANIDANRHRNDPDSHPEYVCDIYNKMELDLTHPREQLLSLRPIKENFPFLFEYIDTSTVSGVPYLPIMLSETVAERRHRSNPAADNETVKANRISGINPEGNMLSQFTGSLHLKVNFYKPFINAFDLEFPSPIQASGMLYYNYYIIDSMKVDGRKTYLVRYHPKALVSTPAFDGEMRIDAQDYALRSIHANMKNTTNVNWLRDLVIDAEYARQPDSTWFYASDSYYADFSVSVRDSSRMLSFIGKRDLTYSNPRFELGSAMDDAYGLVNVDPESHYRDDAFWQAVRPEPLSPKEENVYAMVSEIKDVPFYKGMYKFAYTLVDGYYNVGKIGFGPYHKIISFNDLEGVRPYFGMRTGKTFSNTDRIMAYTAYGTRDKTWKGGARWEHMFRKEPMRKLEVNVKYDLNQLGSGSNDLASGNIFGSIMSGSHSIKPCMMQQLEAHYDHEFSMNVNGLFGMDFRRYYTNRYVSLFAPDSSAVRSVAQNEIYGQLRFSWDETVNRGQYKKLYVYSKYPVLTLRLTGSIPGLRQGDYGYLRPQVFIGWDPRIPPIGMSRIALTAGKIIGKVPYPLLHIHEGNSSYLSDKGAFSTMEYLEFASDQWATLFYYHCFNGFFFGKVPLIRKLSLREEFTLRATWGTLSKQNNGDATVIPLSEMEAPMLFPEGMHALGGPFVEVGAGISNIFKFLRVDCFWRVTHRAPRDAEGRNRNFAVNIGAEFRF